MLPSVLSKATLLLGIIERDFWLKVELKIVLTWTELKSCHHSRVRSIPDLLRSSLLLLFLWAFHVIGLWLEFFKHIITIFKPVLCECLIPFNVIRYSINCLIWNEGNKTTLQQEAVLFLNWSMTFFMHLYIFKSYKIVGCSLLGVDWYISLDTSSILTCTWFNFYKAGLFCF